MAKDDEVLIVDSYLGVEGWATTTQANLAWESFLDVASITIAVGPDAWVQLMG